MLDNQGIVVKWPAGVRDLSLLQTVQTSSAAHLLSTQSVPGALSLGIKWPGHDTDHPPPPSAKVKSEMSYTSTPHMYSQQVQGKLYLYLIP